MYRNHLKLGFIEKIDVLMTTNFHGLDIINEQLHISSPAVPYIAIILKDDIVNSSILIDLN